MAHELEIGANGQVAFALRGAPAWHKLQNVTLAEDAKISTAEMLSLAHLDNWNVRLEPVSLPEGYTTAEPQFMTVRDNPFDGGKNVLGFVGKRYVELQNEEAFAFADGILDGGAEWDTAGSIKNGKQVFGSLVVPKEFTLDPQGANDTTKTYLLIHTSHDGSTAISANITPVRVVCQNTLNMALGNSPQSFKVRHTQTLDGRLAEARRALGLTFAHMDAFEAEAQKLFETAITDDQFTNIITKFYAEPEDGASKTAKTRYENKVDALQELWKNSPTNANIKNTAWGVLNTMTERIDYYRTGRGNADAIVGAASGFDPVVNAEKNRIFKMVRELANA